MLPQPVGKPRRQDQDVAKQTRQLAVMVEEGENLHAGRQTLDKSGEGGESGIRVLRIGKMFQHRRHDSRQKGAGPLAARRGNAAGHPAGKDGRDVAGAGKAACLQPGHEPVLILQKRRVGSRIRRVLEQPVRRMAFNPVETG